MLEAIAAAESKQRKGFVLTKEKAYTLLQACAKQEQRHLESIRRIHTLIIFAGLDFVEVLCNHLIRLFASSTCLFEAALLFNSVSLPSAHTWSSILAAYVALGQPQVTLRLYLETFFAGFGANKCIVLAALKACASSIHFLLHGMLIHHVLVSDGTISEDVAVHNALIHLYTSCGRDVLANALYLFAVLRHKTLASWNTLLSGYAKAGNMQLAMDWLEDMQLSGVHPNAVSWGVIISGHASINQGIHALECFQRMEQQGILPDKVILLSALKACGCARTVVQGRLLHNQIVKSNQHLDAELGTALVDMYMKCGSLQESVSTFLNLPSRQAGPWNALIAGYTKCGNLELALQGIETMRQGGVKPDVVTVTTMIGACAQHGDAVLALDLFRQFQGVLHPNAHTFSSVLKACAILGALEDGRGIHDQLLRSGIQSIVVENALANMYVKCDSLEESHKLLIQQSYRNVISWGALIAGYSDRGDLKLALYSFDDMLKDGIEPNEAIFASLLSACSHRALVDEGCKCFWTMITNYGIKPSIQHHICVVDLLARSGLLTEAESFLCKLPIDTNGWRPMLNAGRTFGNIKLARRCFNASVLI